MTEIEEQILGRLTKIEADTKELGSDMKDIETNVSKIKTNIDNIATIIEFTKAVKHD